MLQVTHSDSTRMATMRRGTFRDSLAGTDLFADCTRAERRMLDRTGTPLHRPARSVLAVQGSVVDQVVLIMAGSATAIDDRGAATLGAGDLVGATEVRRRRPHPRTVLVTSDCDVVVFDPAEFALLLGAIPRLAARLASVDLRTAPSRVPVATVRTHRPTVADIVLAVSR